MARPFCSLGPPLVQQGGVGDSVRDCWTAGAGCRRTAGLKTDWSQANLLLNDVVSTAAAGNRVLQSALTSDQIRSQAAVEIVVPGTAK